MWLQLIVVTQNFLFARADEISARRPGDYVIAGSFLVEGF